MDSFKTIKKQSQGIYKEKGSKFIGLAFPVANETEIKEILDKIKKEYHDARHHCYAWRLGENLMNFRANDDGEPNNSAGKPILGQIDAKSLSNVLVIVVRYFGGTLLGVGGLIQAYKAASFEALQNSIVIDHFIYHVYGLEFNYESMNTVMKVIKDMNLEVFDTNFEMDCFLKVKLKRSQAGVFVNAFELEKNIKLKDLGESESY